MSAKIHCSGPKTKPGQLVKNKKKHKPERSILFNINCKPFLFYVGNNDVCSTKHAENATQQPVSFR